MEIEFKKLNLNLSRIVCVCVVNVLAIFLKTSVTDLDLNNRRRETFLLN